jgi:hypothetical protein
MSQRNLDAGHLRFIRQKIGIKLYKDHYLTACDAPLSWKTFQYLMNDKIFVVKGADPTVCLICFKNAHRGILARAPHAFDLLEEQLGAHEVKHMRTRCVKIVHFLLTERSRHVNVEDGDANHCGVHMLSSWNDTRFNTPCHHARSEVDIRPSPGPQGLWSDVGNRSGTGKRSALHLACDCDGVKGHTNCKPVWGGTCESCEVTPIAGKSGKIGKNMANCLYCQLVACNTTSGPNRCADRVCGERRGGDHINDSTFVCVECVSDLDLDDHINGCGFCDEVRQFQIVLKDLEDRACAQAESNAGGGSGGSSSSSSSSSSGSSSSSAPAISNAQRIQKYVGALRKSIEHLEMHQVRHGMMSKYRPWILDLIKMHKLYQCIVVLSDFWKKFDGIALANALCDMDAAMSVEGHVIMGLIPPSGAIPNFKSDTFDATCVGKEDGFFVLYVTQISKTTTQDWRQKMCNRIALFRDIKVMLPHVTGAFTQSDGAYNDNTMALHMALLGKVTGIYVLGSGHNEPGHGGDRVDSWGACLIAHMWAWVRDILHNDIAIDSPDVTCRALVEPPLAGSVARVVDHDPAVLDGIYDKKKNAFKGVKILDMYWKLYPRSGIIPDSLWPADSLEKYPGGVRMYRFIGCGNTLGGLGTGQSFTEEQMNDMRNGNTLEPSVAVKSEQSKYLKQIETVTYDLDRNDRREMKQRRAAVMEERKAKKDAKESGNATIQRNITGNAMKEEHEQQLSTKKMNRMEVDSDSGEEEEDTLDTKLTRSEARELLHACIKQNHAIRKDAAKTSVSEVDGINSVLVDVEMLESDDVTIENGAVTNMDASSPLWNYGVLGWHVSTDTVVVKKVAKRRLTRPLLEEVPRRGKCNRPKEGNKMKTAKQIAFLNKYCNKKPNQVKASALAKLSIQECGELEQLETEQIKTWAIKWYNGQKDDATRALARQGMPVYIDKKKWTLKKLQNECTRRKIYWDGRNKTEKSFIRKLEDNDDEKKSSRSKKTTSRKRKKR